MALDQTANFVRGSTDASVDSTQTTISVVDASIFPDPSTSEYNLVLWDASSNPRPDQDPSVEIVRVTARDTGTDDLTVSRGQEGTSGASHPSGSALQLSPTAKMFSDIASRYVAEGEDFDGQSTSEFTNLQSVSTDSATVDGKDVPGYGASNSAAPGFDSWTTPDASRPSEVLFYVRSETDGTNPGTIDVNVDESGGTTADYSIRIAHADPNLGSGLRDFGTITIPHQPGAAYLIENVSDPNNANTIFDVREFIQ